MRRVLARLTSRFGTCCGTCKPVRSYQKLQIPHPEPPADPKQPGDKTYNHPEVDTPAWLYLCDPQLPPRLPEVRRGLGIVMFLASSGLFQWPSMTDLFEILRLSCRDQETALFTASPRYESWSKLLTQSLVTVEHRSYVISMESPHQPVLKPMKTTYKQGPLLQMPLNNMRAENLSLLLASGCAGAPSERAQHYKATSDIVVGSGSGNCTLTGLVTALWMKLGDKLALAKLCAGCAALSGAAKRRRVWCEGIGSTALAAAGSCSRGKGCRISSWQDFCFLHQVLGPLRPIGPNRPPRVFHGP